MRRTACVVALVLVAAACTLEVPVNSNDIATADLDLRLVITGTSTDTAVDCTILGPGRTVRVVEGDAVALATPVGSWPFAVPDGGFAVTLPPTGGDFELSFTRPAGRGGDLHLKTFLAAPFVVTPPASASRADKLSIVWTGAGSVSADYTTLLTIGGPCIAGTTRTFAVDPGGYTFNPFELASSAAAPGTCTVRIDVTKTTPYSKQSANATLEMTP